MMPRSAVGSSPSCLRRGSVYERGGTRGPQCAHGGPRRGLCAHPVGSIVQTRPATFALARSWVYKYCTNGPFCVGCRATSFTSPTKGRTGTLTRVGLDSARRIRLKVIKCLQEDERTTGTPSGQARLGGPNSVSRGTDRPTCSPCKLAALSACRVAGEQLLARTLGRIAAKVARRTYRFFFERVDDYYYSKSAAAETFGPAL